MFKGLFEKLENLGTARTQVNIERIANIDIFLHNTRITVTNILSKLATGELRQYNYDFLLDQIGDYQRLLKQNNLNSETRNLYSVELTQLTLLVKLIQSRLNIINLAIRYSYLWNDEGESLQLSSSEKSGRIDTALDYTYQCRDAVMNLYNDNSEIINQCTYCLNAYASIVDHFDMLITGWKKRYPKRF